VDSLAELGRVYFTRRRRWLAARLAAAVLRAPWRVGGWLMLFGLALPRLWSEMALRILARANLVPGVRPCAGPLAGDIVAIVVSTGEDTYERCLASVRAQSVPARLKTVLDVAPMSAAFNRALDLADGEFHCIVDADMILSRHCFRRLLSMLRDEPRAYCALGLLRDPLLGKVGWVKMFRTEMTRGLRYQDVIACDVQFDRALRDRGWLRLETDEVLGQHISLQDPGRTFHTYRRRGQKARLFWPEAIAKELRRIAIAFARRRDALTAAALIGYCQGLSADDKGEKDFRDIESRAEKLAQVLRNFELT